MNRNIFLSATFALASLCQAQVTANESPSANRELEKIYAEDQSDRTPSGGGPLDWSIVRPRDLARHQRVLELYRAGELKTGKDLFHAAMVLQHGDGPEDFLLSHELCVTAVFAHSNEPGDWIKGAKWLAAASEDRFLGAIGRKQRFGTQYKTHDPDPTWRLDPVDDGVTDAIRHAWNVPTLDEATRREAEMNKATAK